MSSETFEKLGLAKPGEHVEDALSSTPAPKPAPKPAAKPAAVVPEQRKSSGTMMMAPMTAAALEKLVAGDAPGHAESPAAQGKAPVDVPSEAAGEPESLFPEDEPRVSPESSIDVVVDADGVVDLDEVMDLDVGVSLGEDEDMDGGATLREGQMAAIPDVDGPALGLSHDTDPEMGRVATVGEGGDGSHDVPEASLPVDQDEAPMDSAPEVMEEDEGPSPWELVAAQAAVEAPADESDAPSAATLAAPTSAPTTGGVEDIHFNFGDTARDGEMRAAVPDPPDGSGIEEVDGEALEDAMLAELAALEPEHPRRREQRDEPLPAPQAREAIRTPEAAPAAVAQPPRGVGFASFVGILLGTSLAAILLWLYLDNMDALGVDVFAWLDLLRF